MGISTENGFIEIHYHPTLFLYISHIGYGTLTYHPEQIENAIRNRKILMEINKPRMLQPVTVLALKKSIRWR